MSNKNFKKLCSFPTNSARELHVLHHDRDALGVESTQVCVLKDTYEISLRSLLKCPDRRALKPQIHILANILGNLADEALERKLADKELSGFLKASNLLEGCCTWTESLGLSDACNRWSALPDSLAVDGLGWCALRTTHSA